MKRIKMLFSGLLVLAFACTANASVILDITFDDFPNETYFGVWEEGADTSDIFAGIAYDVSASSPIGFGDGYVLVGDFTGEDPGPWQFVWELDGGNYVFGIFDSFGDGICCGFGFGSYSLSVDGTVLAIGGVFDDAEFIPFVVEDADPDPVSSPSIVALLGLGLIGLRLSRRKNI